MKNKTYFILFATILVLIFGIKTIQQYQTIQNAKQVIIHNQAKTLANFIESFRLSYQDVFLKNHIPVNDNTINLLPVKTTPTISENFAQRQNNNIIIRTVSDRPRNPKNQANKQELEIIKYFKEHPEKKELFFDNNNNIYSYIKPLYIKKSCLKCHGKKKDTLISIQNKYKLAYNYNIGDLRGILHIKIKTKQHFQSLYLNIKQDILFNILLLISLLFIIHILLKKLNKKEEEYQVYLHSKIMQQDTKITEQESSLYYQAHHDALTGLANRTLLLKELEEKLKSSKQHNKKLALMFIDLDQFKQINDSLGHDIGDKVLKIASKRIQSKIRSTDLLARLGGDEFVVLIYDFKDYSSLSHIASNILTATSEAINIADHTLYVSSSIGISVYPKDATSSKDLLKFADTAMYKAKDEGRNNYQYYNKELTQHAYDKITIKTELKEAIKNNEFITFLQPQIDITTNQLIGVEALTRWQHPKKGLLTPKHFIDIAASNGLIVELDRYIMEQNIKLFAKWYQTKQYNGTLSLNITISNLLEHDFISYTKDLLHKYDFDPHKLILEITESEMMKKHNLLIKKLNSLSELGISIAIDDFGTGYSSLSYLKKLPIKKLKIDKSFILDLPNDHNDRSIVKAIISLAQNLHLELIAEGVETSKQKEFLEQNGCTNLQGYYFSKPISIENFIKTFISIK